MEEIWKPVEDYGGLYEVSNKGRVRSLPRATTRGKVLKQKEHMNGRGYKRVCLSKRNIRKSKSVHRLVAAAFIPNPQGLPEVNHIDGNPRNNSVKNLEWVTRSQNELHAFRVLGKKPNKPWLGKPRKFARLFTDDQIRKIRADARPSRIIGNEYGVSKTTILKIKHRKIYREVKDEHK